MRPTRTPSPNSWYEYSFPQALCTIDSELQNIIRQTAARHIDLTLPYRLQDPGTLEEIRREVLLFLISSQEDSDKPLRDVQVMEQCPTLDAMYTDAWPIDSYLQLALKKHTSSAMSRQTSSTSAPPARPSGRCQDSRVSFVMLRSLTTMIAD